MSIVLHAVGYSTQEVENWQEALAKALPDDRLEIWPDVADDNAVEYALVWGHKPGDLSRFVNLKAVFSLGAGVETALCDESLPEDLPLVRLIDPNLANAMAEYMLMRVLFYHRQMHLYQDFQNGSQWQALPYISALDRTVGILGLGKLGAEVATVLSSRGFHITGWSRTSKQLADITCYSGEDGLEHVLREADILICLLPLTSETRGLMCSKSFELMKSQACFINAGRGGHVVVQDLIEALDARKLAHATLDVFETEPLPHNYPLWQHPKVTITPHVSAMTLAIDAPLIIAENIRKLRAGQMIEGLVDREKEY